MTPVCAHRRPPRILGVHSHPSGLRDRWVAV